MTQDLLLVMDVARFKYPPHWVSVSSMFQAMNEYDPTTGDDNTHFNT